MAKRGAALGSSSGGGGSSKTIYDDGGGKMPAGKPDLALLSFRQPGINALERAKTMYEVLHMEPRDKIRGHAGVKSFEGAPIAYQRYCLYKQHEAVPSAPGFFEAVAGMVSEELGDHYLQRVFLFQCGLSAPWLVQEMSKRLELEKEAFIVVDNMGMPLEELLRGVEDNAQPLSAAWAFGNRDYICYETEGTTAAFIKESVIFDEEAPTSLYLLFNDCLRVEEMKENATTLMDIMTAGDVACFIQEEDAGYGHLVPMQAQALLDLPQRCFELIFFSKGIGMGLAVYSVSLLVYRGVDNVEPGGDGRNLLPNNLPTLPDAERDAEDKDAKIKEGAIYCVAAFPLAYETLFQTPPPQRITVDGRVWTFRPATDGRPAQYETDGPQGKLTVQHGGYFGSTHREDKNLDQATKERWGEHGDAGIDKGRHHSRKLTPKLKVMVQVGEIPAKGGRLRGWVEKKGIQRTCEIVTEVLRLPGETLCVYELKLSDEEQAIIDKAKAHGLLLNTMTTAGVRNPLRLQMAGLEGAIESGLRLGVTVCNEILSQGQDVAQLCELVEAATVRLQVRFQAALDHMAQAYFDEANESAAAGLKGGVDGAAVDSLVSKLLAELSARCTAASSSSSFSSLGPAAPVLRLLGMKLFYDGYRFKTPGDVEDEMLRDALAAQSIMTVRICYVDAAARLGMPGKENLLPLAGVSPEEAKTITKEQFLAKQKTQQQKTEEARVAAMKARPATNPAFKTQFEQHSIHLAQAGGATNNQGKGLKNIAYSWMIAADWNKYLREARKGEKKLNADEQHTEAWFKRNFTRQANPYRAIKGDDAEAQEWHTLHCATYKNILSPFQPTLSSATLQQLFDSGHVKPWLAAYGYHKDGSGKRVWLFAEVVQAQPRGRGLIKKWTTFITKTYLDWIHEGGEAFPDDFEENGSVKEGRDIHVCQGKVWGGFSVEPEKEFDNMCNRTLDTVLDESLSVAAGDQKKMKSAK